MSILKHLYPCVNASGSLFEENDTRHVDHHFELTKQEFADWINSFVKDFTVDFIDVGDKVNGIPVTIGVEIRRKHENPN